MRRAESQRGPVKTQSAGGGVAELSFIVYSDYL